MPPLTTAHIAAGSLSTREQPEIRAGDLLLRPWRENDADALMGAFEDEAIQRWHVRSVTSRDEAVQMIVGYNDDWRTEKSAHWAVVSPHLVGRVALKALDLHGGVAQVGYWVPAAARGNGVAPLATDAMSAWAFAELGFHRLELGHSTRNAASCRVAEKAGFPAEGTLRSAWLHADGFHDVHLHGRVRGGSLAAE